MYVWLWHMNLVANGINVGLGSGCYGLPGCIGGWQNHFYWCCLIIAHQGWTEAFIHSNRTEMYLEVLRVSDQDAKIHQERCVLKAPEWAFGRGSYKVALPSYCWHLSKLILNNGNQFLLWIVSPNLCLPVRIQTQHNVASVYVLGYKTNPNNELLSANRMQH